MIEDQLTSFETAIVAKDKGFDEYCKYYTWSDSKTGAHVSVVGSSNKGTPCKQEEWDDVEKGKRVYTISRPTQSLLQRWLREVHKKYVLVNLVILNREPEEIGFRASNYFPAIYPTYEEALEKGIEEALKLIK